MTFSIALPFLICLAGILLWAIAAQSKPPNDFLMWIGKICYGCGLLVTLFECENHALSSSVVVTYVPLAVCVAGLLMWALASNGITKEMGKIAFAAGLLVTLFASATRVVSF
jgi:hypothetical protein